MPGELVKLRGCGIQRTTHSIIRSRNRTSGDVSSFFSWRPFVELFPFDAEYLRRLRAGDPVTEDHFTQYFSELLTIKLRARRLVRGDLLEITQETFFRVWKALRSGNSIQSPDRIGSYVNSVCNNILHEWYRVKLRTDQLPEGWDEPTAIDVDQLLVSAEDAVRVRQALDSLDAKDAELLRDFYLRDRPKAELCRDRNVTGTYIRVLLHRAREKFRRAYLRKIDQDKRDEYKDDDDES